MATAAALLGAGLAAAPTGAHVNFSGSAPVWLAGSAEFLNRDAWLAFCAANPATPCVERHFWNVGGTWAGLVPGAGDDVLMAAGQVVRVQAFNSALRGPNAGPAVARDLHVLGRVELHNRLTVRSATFAELNCGGAGVLETTGLAQVALLRPEASGA